MFKLHVISSRDAGLFSQVIEFDTQLAADIAHDKLVEKNKELRQHTIIVTKLYSSV